MDLTQNRKDRVTHHLKTAVMALLDAQIEMLMDAPGPIYDWELPARLSPELLALYKATEVAESAVVEAQKLV